MWLTLEGSIRDGGEVVCCQIECKKLQQPFEGSACDFAQQIVRQIEFENHRQAAKCTSIQFRQPIVLRKESTRKSRTSITRRRVYW